MRKVTHVQSNVHLCDVQVRVTGVRWDYSEQVTWGFTLRCVCSSQPVDYRAHQPVTLTNLRDAGSIVLPFNNGDGGSVLPAGLD